MFRRLRFVRVGTRSALLEIRRRSAIIESGCVVILLATCSCGVLGCHSFGIGANSFSIPTPPVPAFVEPRQSEIAADDSTGITPTTPPVAVLPPPQVERTIDLGAALQLAGADNATIARALEAVRASQAEQLQAQALLLPTLEAGMNLNEHWGSLQSTEGILRDVDRQALYIGAGAEAIGAGTVAIPGVHLTAQLAEAVFEPIAARQNVVGRRFDAAATRNAVLLEVVDAYFDLIGAEARLSSLHQSQAELDEIARITGHFATTGAGREGDANRASSEALLVRAEEQRVQEEAAVASAELARLLDLDSATRLHGPGGPLPFLQLISPDAELGPLLQIAVANHPEIAARTADLAVAETRWREERVRPFVPLVSVAFSAGQFGGGSNLTDTRFGHFDGRTDFDVLAVWSVENLGLGNWATQRQRRAVVEERAAERLVAVDRVRRETAEAFAEIAARQREVEVARREIQTASASYREDLRRVRNRVKNSRPIEVLISATQLADARQSLIRSVINFNRAQFRLYVALGQPPLVSASPQDQ
jgi:outer membrane protein TolC